MANKHTIQTHYEYSIYPTKTSTPKTQDGFAPRPMIQRKAVKDARPLVEHETIILGPIVEAGPIVEEPKPRSKFRKNIDKAALAEYFDNDVLPSRAEIAQEKLDTWLMQSMFELDWIDIEKAKQKITEEEIRKFVESKKDTDIVDFRNEDNKDIEEGTYDPWVEIADYANTLDHREFIAKLRQRKPVISNAQRAANKTRKEINESVVDRFINKYAGADNAATMRALDKQRLLNKYIIRKIQKTK